MLSDIAIRQSKTKEKAYRLFDSGGLYLDILPSNKKVWRFKYHFHNKEKLLTLGPYPSLSLKEARGKRDEAKEILSSGEDPSYLKQKEKKLAQYSQAQTFEAVAREWHAKYYATWSKTHADNILHRLKINIFPEIGSIPISKLTPPEVLVCVQKIEKRSKEMARRSIQMIGQILRYGVGTGRAERDFTKDLRGLLTKYVRGHFAAIEIDELPDLIKALDKNDKRLFNQTIRAVKLIMLTLVRTGELIKAERTEINLNERVWTIPGERMKMRRPHIVPLSNQAVKLFEEQLASNKHSKFVFPSITRHNHHMSNNTILMALDRMKYRGRMTGHGFRALGMSAIKEKLGYRHEVIDRQLAHLPKSKVDQAYDRAKFIPERIKMMQEWADYLDSII